MKKRMFTGILCAAMMAAGTLCAAEPAKDNAKENMKKVYQFIKSAGHYFIATAEGDQPRVRPFGTVHIYKDRLYIQTGKKKNVSKQLGKNGKVEICTMKGDSWIRVTGKLINDDSVEAKASMLDEYPELKSMYSAEDDNTQVLYFDKGAKAVIYSFKAEPVTLNF